MCSEFSLIKRKARYGSGIPQRADLQRTRGGRKESCSSLSFSRLTLRKWLNTCGLVYAFAVRYAIRGIGFLLATASLFYLKIGVF